MIFGWFSGDEFKDFRRRAKRLEKFIKISDRELLIDHYEELRTHFKKAKRLFDKLLELYSRELDKIESLQESEYKEELKALIAELKVNLQNLKLFIDNGLLLTEEILKIRVVGMVTQQKGKLIRIINNILSIIGRIEEESNEIRVIYQRAERMVNPSYIRPVTKIKMTGRMYNHWELADIQNVVIQLGGWVEKGDGRHPYKIIFPGKRPIPLGLHSPPDEIVSKVYQATGQNPAMLRASFSKGHLVRV